jgi:membrane protein
VQGFGSYNKTYGTLAGLVLLLVYMRWSSYILLLGGEINQVIEKHSPGGKKPGEEAPGQPHPKPEKSLNGTDAKQKASA